MDSMGLKILHKSRQLCQCASPLFPQLNQKLIGYIRISLDLLSLLKTVAVWGRSPAVLDDTRSASKSFKRSNKTLVET